MRIPVSVILGAMLLGNGLGPQAAPAALDPALSRLQVFLGSWSMATVFHPGRFGKTRVESTGQAIYRWGPGRLWLMYEVRTSIPGVGAYEVNGVVTHDRQAGLYRAWSFNGLATRMMEYTGEWKDNRLVFTGVARSAEGTWPRVSYEVLGDHGIRFVASESSDGVHDEPYFEATLSREAPSRR